MLKICGVTRPEDAEMAARSGATAIGVNFWPGSKRFVKDDRAAEIVRAVPPGVLKVGVFVNAHPLVVSETVEEMGLDRIQLHGSERVADFGGIEIGRIIRTIRVKDQASLKEAKAWEAGMYLYEGDVEGLGGQGARAPWELIARGARRPFLLAGGLTPDNVIEAIRLVRPQGVDVASGVESDTGIKDPAKLRAFIENARLAADEMTDPG